ncbi:MAG: hypothetical protein LBG65_03805 [Puniceicoccales bacterium]|jgi:tetratricopeptide (TPR) repeat protein|nr:hypothetical protein [Puniceicoccales bacterium]
MNPDPAAPPPAKKTGKSLRAAAVAGLAALLALLFSAPGAWFPGTAGGRPGNGRAPVDGDAAGSPAGTEGHLALGLRLRASGRLQEAIAAFTTAIQIHNGPREANIEASHQRALAFMDAGDPAKAVSDWTEILCQWPLPPEILRRTLLFRAAAYRRLENWQAAWDDERAARSVP